MPFFTAGRNEDTLNHQVADTTIFIVIAFYGTMPLSALIAMIFTQYAFKWAAAALDTPLVYLLVKICRRERITRPSYS